MSGVPCTEAATLAARFEKVLREREPELWDECEKELARSSRKRAHDGGDSAADGVRSVKFWDSVRTEEVNAEDEPFAFDFGDNADDVSDAAEAAVPLR